MTVPNQGVDDSELATTVTDDRDCPEPLRDFVIVTVGNRHP